MSLASMRAESSSDVAARISSLVLDSAFVDIVEAAPREEQAQRVRDYVEVLTGRQESGA